ncbi:hypothetical protein SAMN04488137_4010 [Fictibacillus solisalsi]|uniref:Uracil DNA glycosylase superfamily protein n=1 Tax=Fictibacillus solisalsi TaxID=459525 RepID=A0A1H0A9W7_9BACL|nr:hypothetical protein [Fictibacillus solisalsi]SDN30389.1 hypothetical protein SAMN04488137_4010 [Fictibacillus solisalsi]
MKLFDHYQTALRSLPVKERYRREDLLTSAFLMEKNGHLEMYYSPHNEAVNENGKIMIIGITPGWVQMELAFRTARRLLEEQKDTTEILTAAKKAAQFSGSMRTHLVQMLDELGLPSLLDLPGADALFGEERQLLHTVSIIKYPLFVNGKNYTGHQPPIRKSSFLMNYARDTLETDILALERPLIIPLGKAVEDVLRVFIGEGKIEESQCLLGFPHPSGANGHRHRQLRERKRAMQEKLRTFFAT